MTGCGIACNGGVGGSTLLLSLRGSDSDRSNLEGVGEFKRGEAPLQKNLPLPLDKGKGIKGIGLIKLWLKRQS